MINTNRDRDTLQDDYNRLMLRIAFCELQDEEIEQLSDFGNNELENIQQEDDFWKKTEAQAKSQMYNHLLRQKVIHAAKVTLPKIVQVAACLIIAFYVTLSVAIAADHNIRVRVLEMIMNVEKQYTEISLQENNAKSFHVPSEWKGTYYPAYIPDGFVIEKISSLYGLDTLECLNENMYLSFLECGEDVSTNIDTEGALVEAILINGSPAIIAEKGGLVTIAWAYNRNYFVLQAQVGREIAIQIAESVMVVKN